MATAVPEALNTWLWTVVFVIICTLTPSIASTLYFDKFGHCVAPNPFLVDDDQHTILAKGGEPYSTLRCELSFKASRDDQLCLNFVSYDIENCDVQLVVYDKNSASGNFLEKFTCGSNVHNVCSSGRYMTLLLKKRSLKSKHYDFELVIREKSESDAFMDGIDGFVLSISVIIGIIVGVVGLIAILAIIIVCCCRRKGSQGRVYRKAPKAASECESLHAEINRIPVQPSAPPMQDNNGAPPMTHPHDVCRSFPPQTFPLEPPPAYSPVPPPQGLDQVSIKT